MEYSFNLLPVKKKQQKSSKEKIVIYDLASSLYQELDSMGIITRLKETPQLGLIETKPSLTKSRYDYISLQAHFHQLLKAQAQSTLQYTYGSNLNLKDFSHSFTLSGKVKISFADILQILILVYNIGHFHNTFTSSMAAVTLLGSNKLFYETFISSCKDERFKYLTNKIIEEQDYHHLHLLNSLIILEQCDSNSDSVILAKEIIYSYINPDSLDSESKLRYIFYVFKIIRNLAFISYDLQVSDLPLIIDICNSRSIVWLINELVSKYNDTTSSKQLLNSISKCLDDKLYFNNVNAICYYQITKKIIRNVNNEIIDKFNYYKDFLINPQSAFNISYPKHKAFNKENILKLTFSKEEHSTALEFFKSVSIMDCVQSGYYNRYSGEMTILISLKNSCKKKDKVAFKVFKCAIKYLQQIKEKNPSDKRYLLSTKFLLYYIFDQHYTVIEPTIDNDICVLCTRGKTQRIEEINNLIFKNINTLNAIDNEPLSDYEKKENNRKSDQYHEVEFLKTCLYDDTKNDVTITVPASIVVYDKSRNKTLKEFDGLIIHPNRENNQILFLESKNTKNHPNFATNCLSKKFDALNIDYDINNFKTIDHDVYYPYTI